VLCPGPSWVIAMRRWHQPGLGLAWSSESGSLLKGGGSSLIRVLPFSPGVMNALYIASSHPRPSVRGEEPQPMGGGPVCAEHSGSKGVNPEYNPQSYSVSAVPMG
jgi:hypothetical protein